ncbi:hypothetical protein FOZ60_008484 [Perkinsus olseni]|uniref:Uncharacterized protein n=2 Tax=Perkinsus olseni TaxID=32597 RepID=A0A7J6PDR4_PEROL|nr:hypothetical protein FOZ60_008484 [Perkinsus olseni]
MIIGQTLTHSARSLGYTTTTPYRMIDVTEDASRPPLLNNNDDTNGIGQGHHDEQTIVTKLNDDDDPSRQSSYKRPVQDESNPSSNIDLHPQGEGKARAAATLRSEMQTGEPVQTTRSASTQKRKDESIVVVDDSKRLTEIAAAKVRRWRSESCRRNRIRREWVQRREHELEHRKAEEAERVKQEKRQRVLRARHHRKEAAQERSCNNSHGKNRIRLTVSVPPSSSSKPIRRPIEDRPEWRSPSQRRYTCGDTPARHRKDEERDRSVEARSRAMRWMREGEARRRRTLQRELEVQRMLEEESRRRKESIQRGIAERNRLRREAFERRQRGASSHGYRRVSVSLERSTEKRIPLPRYKSIEREAALRKENEEQERKRILLERKMRRGLVPMDHEEIQTHMHLVDSITAEATERARHRSRMQRRRCPYENEGIEGQERNEDPEGHVPSITEDNGARIRMMRQRSYAATIQRRLTAAVKQPKQCLQPGDSTRHHDIRPPATSAASSTPGPLHRRPLVMSNSNAIASTRKRTIARIREYRRKRSPSLITGLNSEAAPSGPDPSVERRLAAVRNANEYISSGVHRELAIKRHVTRRREGGQNTGERSRCKKSEGPTNEGCLITYMSPAEKANNNRYVSVVRAKITTLSRFTKGIFSNCRNSSSSVENVDDGNRVLPPILHHVNK